MPPPFPEDEQFAAGSRADGHFPRLSLQSAVRYLDFIGPGRDLRHVRRAPVVIRERDRFGLTVGWPKRDLGVLDCFAFQVEGWVRGWLVGG